MLKKVFGAMFCLIFITVCSAIDSKTVNKWSIKPHNGVVTVFHNNKPVILNILYENDSWMTKYMGTMCNVAKEAHINMYLMHVALDIDDKCPIPEMSNVKNFYKKAMSRIEKLMQADPGAYIMIRVPICPPKSWFKTHRNHMIQNEKGELARGLLPPISYFSDEFYDKVDNGLRKMVEFIENSKYGNRIFGYHVSIKEWGRAQNSPSRLGDYSPVAQQAFRRYLLKKYGSLAQVNSALKTRFKKASDICVPAEVDFIGTDGNFFKSPQDVKYTMEYFKMTSETVAKRILTLCKTIKKVNPDRLAGVPYNYLFGPAQGGVRGLLGSCHFAWSELGSSPYLDYIWSPPYYELCGPSSPGTGHTLLGSVALYGKAYLMESDHPTHLVCHLPEIVSTPVLWTYKMAGNSKGMLALYKKFHDKIAKLPPGSRWGIDYGKNYRKFLIEAEKKNKKLNLEPSPRIPSNMQESVANVLRLGMSVICKPTSGIWWWDMEGCLRKCTGGISYNHPTIIKALRQVDKMFKKAVTLDRRPVAKVAVFYSTESIYYAKAGMKRWEYLRDSMPLNLRPLGESGVAFTDYYFEDIEKIKNIDQYKLLIFVNAHYITSERRKWMDEHLKKDGRVLVWFYGSGYIDEKACSVKNMEQITGINFKEMNRREMLACRISNDKHPLNKGIPLKSPFGSYRTGKRKSPLAKPHFVVTDPKATTLGLSYRRNEPVFAIKKFKDWTSVYLPGGKLPTMLVKNLARQAKINVYTDSDDIQVWAVKSMIGIYSYPKVKGVRTIYLPGNIKECRDFISGKVYKIEDNKIKIKFNGAQSILLITKLVSKK
jgi:Beta-galactosidase